MKRVQTISMLAMTLLVALQAPAADGVTPGSDLPAPVQPWPDDVVDLWKTLPIQDGGRLKPFDTFAAFKMLKLHGKRTMRVVQDGATIKLSPVEWLLDCLFRPDTAMTHPTFAVDNYSVIVAIGLPPHKEKRSRYSYAELEPGIGRLFELAKQYSEINAPQRNGLQTMTVNLAANVSDFEYLLHYFDFARLPLRLSAAELSPNVDGPLMTTDALQLLPALRQLYLEEQSHDPDATGPVVESLAQIMHYADTSRALALLPPPDSDILEWRAPGQLIRQAFQGPLPAGELELLQAVADLPKTAGTPARFKEQLQKFHGLVTERAEARGEYGKIRLEVAFYKGNYFYYSLCLYVLGFLCIALSWLGSADSRSSRVLTGAAIVLTALPLTLHVTGIVLRCIVRSRPPVSTLYETILFTSAIAVFAALLMEYMNRQRIALALASVLGVAGMFLANKYEVKEAVDTMPSLVAVLDTNFWLATHVTTITIGYAAGLLAAAIAHVYVLAKLFRLKQAQPEFFQSLTRMVYGVLCFGLLFSFSGTVLGGIWANDSWGRFWGWDPKENGALMLVRWSLIILHARLGGYIRDYGLHTFAVFGGMIVAFSWWGVNLLGVGLHSYGFTSGAFRALVIFWCIEGGIILLGFVAWLRSQSVQVEDG
ncbi:MAG: cytochrome c biogenesis protein CcsA [Lentisphaeria bacterium]|nr:cytochrome c biogenesis protein CcsA [Lentisphaeria bacterium]